MWYTVQDICGIIVLYQLRRQKVKRFYPDNNSLTVLRMIITIFILTIIAAMKYYIPSAKFVIITGIILAAIGFIIMFVYLPIYFSSIKYIVTDSEITKTCGVFIKTHQTVRFSSIQYTTIIRTPFSKYTGLNIIIFLFSADSSGLHLSVITICLKSLNLQEASAERRYENASRTSA